MTLLRLVGTVCLGMVLVAIQRTPSAQEPTPAGVLAPAKSGLEPVPLPILDELEPAVADQLRDARQAYERAAQPARSSRELAEAYGALARVFHAYEFFEAAEPAYANAARLSPGDGRWPHLLGYLYQQAGRLEESATRFEAALRVQPADRAAAVRLGDVYLGLNRLRDAREQFESVLTGFPAAARNGLGEVALREGRYSEAIAHFRDALERVPQATSLHYSLAMAYRGAGRLDDARSHLQQRGPGRINPVDPLVEALPPLVRGERLLVIQGRRAYEAGQLKDAADAFRRAIAAAPGSVPARLNLGVTLGQLGDGAGALEQLHAAYALAPGDVAGDEGILLNLAILLAERERYRDAVAVLEEGQRRFPDRTRTATTLARLLASSPDLALRNGARALDLATTVRGVSPAPAAAETIALALAELSRCAEALEWMRRAVTESERAGDTAETARLKAGVPRFESATCRAPGR